MDDTMNKRPSLQWYPADWLKDPDLQMCSMNTVGIWINLLCRMWESKEEGILRGKIGELALLVGAKPSEFKRFIKEAKTHNFCDVLHDVTESYTIVTIKCRRMNKLFLEREGAKKRMKRHRSKSSNGNVTSPSSTSPSSTPSKQKKKFIPPTLEEVRKYITENPELNNIDPVDFWKGYSDGGWIDTQGKPVRNWKLKLRTRSNYAVTAHSSSKTKLYPIKGRICGVADCKLPAVYKDTSGSYDQLYCAEHMPAKVKDKYE